ncbi:hypothetical protein DEO23_11140 [Brachybacterium endophyticum]|uniref:Uncharacterized protein n=1 Tax=Brachybacterium endophyticum TaxID=2182385 RepID=A0A2U2RIP0_9MICO|nr:hypothetical protein [Brachybacterium endophyticum]PWH05752.1 hypothetical protein DEO23_11140 [Brachybacterium endophyticum]
MSAARERGVARAGDVLRLPLTAREGDAAEVRVLLDLRELRGRDQAAAEHLSVLGEGVLVEVRVGGRLLLPGAWTERSLLDLAADGQHRPVRAGDLRLPAVVLGGTGRTTLAWGETRWPLQLDASVAIPASCRPSPHSLPELRRLVLHASGRRAEIALTLWQDPRFDVPWHDVRLVPRASWWFEIAQVPEGMRYADAAASQDVRVDRLLPASRM